MILTTHLPKTKFGEQIWHPTLIFYYTYWVHVLYEPLKRVIDEKQTSRMLRAYDRK